MKKMPLIYPVVTGELVAKLKTALAGFSSPVTSNVQVVRDLPKEADRTLRMVTFRDDSGPSEVLATHRVGVNVYAESPLSAEKLALAVSALLAQIADGQPITSVTGFVGPYEVPEDNPMIVSGKTISNFFFSCQVTVRGQSF